MTLQLRPTFSESWYRVAELRAKLRSSAHIFRQFYRGERWYVVRDPAGNQFHRLSDAAYRFVGLLDGRRTVAEAWELVGGQLADDAPTQPEVIQILSQLYSANLLEADISPDATVLLRRHKQLQKRQMQGRLMNVLFPRIPLWDPDRFLKRWMPVMGLLLSKFGAILWMVVVAAGLFILTSRGWDKLFAATSSATDPGNWFFLWVTFVLIKFIHECGHAFACRRFGGEVHEMGIMFLVFVPTPYVDASTAWAFASRWQRMFVGAAGMIFELFVASIMAFVWANTNETSIWNQLAFNAMLIASVTTIIFNANPLLRYDGYYMLSDWLEIPNLQQRSTEYALGLIKRHIFRVKLQQPLPPLGQRAWMLVYAICSSIYRVFVGIAIILFVAFKVPVLGVLMAIGGVVTWLVMPVVKLGRYLMLEPELHRKRGRAIAFSGAIAAAIVILIGLVRFPVHFRTEGVAEPLRQERLFAMTSGFVSQISAHDGQLVHQGDPILICRNDELATEVRQLQHVLAALEIRRQSNVSDPAQRQIDEIEITANQRKLADAQRRLDDLTIRAPIDGRLVAPGLEDLAGRFLPERTEVAMVAAMDQLVVRSVLQQSDAELATMVPRDQWRPEVRLAGASDQVLKAVKVELIQGAQQEVAHPSLTWAGGGQVAADPRDDRQVRTLVPQFEVRVTLDNANERYLPGQMAVIRFQPFSRPLIWQWTNSFLRLIQTESMRQPAGMTP
jgi:putative peptide zinc metalloprotease protein